MKAQRIADLTEKINTTLAKVEELGNEGKVDESMELAKSVEDMKKRKREMEVCFKLLKIAVSKFIFSLNYVPQTQHNKDYVSVKNVEHS